MTREANPAPNAVYETRLNERRAAAVQLERRHVALGNARLAVAGGGVAAAFGSWGFHWFPAEVLWLVVAAYLFLALRHDRVLQEKRRAERAVAFYEAGLRRLDYRWQGQGNPGRRFADAKHPYTADLDIFGVGSLYELLCTTRTRQGETLLADWLRAPADVDTLRERHEAVQELRNNLALREDLFVIGDEVRAALDVSQVAAWGRAPVVFTNPAVSYIANILLVLVVAAGMAWAGHFATSGLLVGVVLVAGLFRGQVRAPLREVLGSVSLVSGELEIFAALLARIESEQETFRSARLRALAAVLETKGGRPSVQLRRLQRLVELLNVTDSIFTRSLEVIVLWSVHLALRIDRWRRDNGPHVGDWLRVAGELEALCALAGYAFEHPDDVFPTFTHETLLQADGVAHPLLDERAAIRNDVRLDTSQRAYIVSGSNMSGKSTLLRAVGVNVVLALAGAPVRAHQFTLCPLNMGASLRTNDDLQAGISRFYAEILRLRQIVALADEPLPLLFCSTKFCTEPTRMIGASGPKRWSAPC